MKEVASCRLVLRGGLVVRGSTQRNAGRYWVHPSEHWFDMTHRAGTLSAAPGGAQGSVG